MPNRRIAARMKGARASTRLLDRAIALAEANVRRGGGPFGAVVARGGKALATGVNRVTSSHDPTAHAEVVAIRRACRRLGDFSLKDCVIYASCEPCPMCLAAIRWARIKAVFYAGSRHDAARAGFDDRLFYDEMKQTPRRRRFKAVRVKAPGRLRPFAAWSAQNDKIPY